MESVIDFFLDPLRLTLIIAGVVVILAIFIFGRRSTKSRDIPYSSSGAKEFSFGARMNEEVLTDEEVIVLPPKKKANDLNSGLGDAPDIRISAKTENEDYVTKHTEAFGPGTTTKTEINETPEELFIDEPAIEATAAKSEAQKVDVKPVQETPIKNQEAAMTQDKKVEQVEQKSAANIDKKPIGKERFVVLYVIAAEGKPFNGKAILDSAQTLGLAFGKHNVFHYPIATAESGHSKFCLVNMTSEGSFPTAELASLETNGVSLIMRLPIANADGLTVFSNMLGVAQALARKLGGDILDQTRMPLTADIVTSLRSDIAHFESEVKQQSVAVPEV